MNNRTQDFRFTLNDFHDKVSFVWFVADLLRGDYTQSEYGKVTNIFRGDAASGLVDTCFTDSTITGGS